MKLNFNFDGKTFLSKWWKIVRDNFTAIQTDHNELSDSVNTHKTAEVIDHPDKSVTSTKIADKAIRTAHIANYAITKDKVANGAVTTDKIAANSITVNELTLDIVANLGKANTFLYSDGEPIYLSECKDTGGIGYELPDDIPVNVFFKLENDTDSALTKFQSHDDYYTTLSCDIAPGEVRICVLIQEEVGGADPQNGYLFVLDDNSIRKLLNDKAPTNHASGATTYGVGDATNYGHLKLSDSTASVSSTGSGIAATPKAVKTISDTLSTEISDRQAADNELKAKFTDLKTVAFTGSYTDLSNKPTTATTSTSGFMSAADKTKLNGIATGANNYTHPSTHPASMIVQDSTHRFVSDNEISDWDNKLDANFVSNGYMGIDEVTETLNDMWNDRVAPPTTITISSSTSKHMPTADYYCTGANGQTEINDAISALPSTGGKIVLLEGTYNINGQINVNKPNVTICGMGNSTVLNCKQGIWGIAATQTNFTVANLKMTFDTYNGNGNSICIYASGSRCKFENLDLSNAVYGINCGGGYSIIHNVTATGNRTNIHLGSGHNVVSDCYSENAQETGVRIEGEYNIVANCYISDAEIYGVLLTGGGKNKVAGNVIKKDSYSDSQHSIRVTSSTYNSCSDNIMIGKNYTNAGGATNTFSNNKYS